MSLLFRETPKHMRGTKEYGSKSRDEHIAALSRLTPSELEVHKSLEECRRTVNIMHNWVEEVRSQVFSIGLVDSDIERKMESKRDAGFVKKRVIDLSLMSLMKEREEAYATYEKKLAKSSKRVRELSAEFSEQCGIDA